MNISSAAFGYKQSIPPKYTCDGASASPPLMFAGMPGDTVSLALIVDDPDVPAGTFTHWLLYNMEPSTTSISENGVPPGSNQGVNSAGHIRYDGPCPPSGIHRYVFYLFALSIKLDLGSGASRYLLESAMHGHILERAELTGLYQKSFA